MKSFFWRRCPARDAAGFTLVEIMIATGITLMMAAMMISIIVHVVGSYDRISGRLNAASEARAVLDTISTDLDSIVFKDDGQVWFALTLANSDQLTKGGNSTATNLWKQPGFPTRQKPSVVDVVADRYGVNGVWLRFFARPTDRDRVSSTSSPIYGDVCAVAYQLLRRGPTTASEGTGTQDSGTRSYGLYRTVVNAANTFVTGYDLSDTQTDYWKGENPGNSLDDAVEILRPDRSLVLASNVIDFGVRLFDQNLKEIVYATTGSGEYLAPRAGAPMPAFLDVYLRVLNDAGARQLLAFEQGKLRADLTSSAARAQFWWETALANSVEFRRRFAVRTGT